MLEAGAQAPTLKQEAHNGQVIDLAALSGPTVVYFYPKDATPGCTKEACAFRDAWTRYEDAGILVVGVSADSNESHQKFADEHQLPFPLIADESLKWAEAFGVGTTAGMTKRVSFLLDAEGTIQKTYPDVDPGVHADEVLTAAEAFKAKAK